MLNDVRLSGKVICAYIDDEGYFVCTFSCLHEDEIDGKVNTYPSVFRGRLMNKEKSAHMDIVKGDKITVIGYLKQDITLSKTGNERKRMNLYIKELDLVERKTERTPMGFDVEKFWKSKVGDLG